MDASVDCSNFMGQTEQEGGRVDRYRFRICPKIILLTSIQPDRSLFQVTEKAFSSYTEEFRTLYLSSSALLLLPLTDEPLQLQISARLKQEYWLGWLTRLGGWKCFGRAGISTALPRPKCSESPSKSTESTGI